MLLAGIAGGFIGRTVAQVGCSGPTCSELTNAAVGLLAGLVAAGGVGIVVVLADRSLREWNEWRSDGGDLPAGGPPDDTDPAGLG